MWIPLLAWVLLSPSQLPMLVSRKLWLKNLCLSTRLCACLNVSFSSLPSKAKPEYTASGLVQSPLKVNQLLVQLSQLGKVHPESQALLKSLSRLASMRAFKDNSTIRTALFLVKDHTQLGSGETRTRTKLDNNKFTWKWLKTRESACEWAAFTKTTSAWAASPASSPRSPFSRLTISNYEALSSTGPSIINQRYLIVAKYKLITINCLDLVLPSLYDKSLYRVSKE